MLKVTFASISVLALWLLVIHSSDPIEFKHPIMFELKHRSSYVYGKEYIFELPKLPYGPTWDTDSKSPPFAIADAINKGIEERNRLLTDEDFQWFLHAAELCPWDAKTGHWYWNINFVGWKGDNIKGPGYPFSIVVLMDGSTVDPEIRDE